MIAVRRPNRRLVLAALVATLLTAAGLSTALAAGPTLTGTYVTPLTQNTITYTAVRGIRGGSEGNYVVGGVRYPGSLYAATGGGTGMVWYFGTSGIMAGNALVTLQTNSTYAGPIWFMNRKGVTTDSGTVTVVFR